MAYTGNISKVGKAAQIYDARSLEVYAKKLEGMSTTFSGCDMQCLFYVPSDDSYRAYGEVQTISISSARSFAAVRTLGRSRVLEYLRGDRTIAGSIIFTELDSDSIVKIFKTADERESMESPYSLYIDQLPEFNISISAVNEYGKTMTRAIIGVTLVNYGTTLSIDNMYTEAQYTYVAKHVTPFMPSTMWVKHRNSILANKTDIMVGDFSAMKASGLVPKPRARLIGEVDL